MRALWKLVAVAVLAIGCAAPVWAEAPVCCASGDHGKPGATATALGQSSPAVANESRSSEWQAFVFTKSGLRYIELADALGTPHAAFTLVSGSVLQLPIGGDVVQQVAVAPVPVIYEDATVIVGAVTQADGTTTWQVYVK